MMLFKFEGNPNATPPSLPGDFNGNGAVDGADFVLWQKNLGAGNEAVLNGNGNGANGVDAGDLVLWKANFGSTQSVGAASAVPEPRALVLLAGGLGILIVHCRRQLI
jgi:hypothetical protein